jgi:hypothetical protein
MCWDLPWRDLLARSLGLAQISPMYLHFLLSPVIWWRNESRLHIPTGGLSEYFMPYSLNFTQFFLFQLLTEAGARYLSLTCSLTGLPFRL